MWRFITIMTFNSKVCRDKKEILSSYGDYGNENITTELIAKAWHCTRVITIVSFVYRALQNREERGMTKLKYLWKILSAMTGTVYFFIIFLNLKAQ